MGVGILLRCIMRFEDICPEYSDKQFDVELEGGLKEGLSMKKSLHDPWDIPGREDNRSETVPHNGGQKS